MASYLRAWWFGAPQTNESNGIKSDETISEIPETSLPQASTSPTPISSAGQPVSVTISTPDETQEAIEESIEVDEDIPPAFPGLNSAQRLSTPRAKASRKSDAALMPPPALPTTLAPPRDLNISSTSGSTPNSVPTAPSVLPPPTPNILKIPGVSGASSNTLQLPPSTTRPPPASSKKRGKVALAPGHSALDWAALKVSGQDLRGVSTLMRVTPSQLKSHNKRDDAWSSFNGKVYNITPYLSFHPGGEKELMRVAGRDGTKLFALTHAWVNVEFMLDECMVGFLVPEPSSAA